ncbi:MAG: phage integrase SAM-like domain-containing protein [Bacteroidota bacterium]
MANINFYLRSYTEKKSQRIWAVFYVDGKIFKIDTNQHVTPLDWSRDKKKALTSFNESVKLNKLLKEQSDFLENFLVNIKLKKKRLYKDELQEEFNRHFKIGENLPKKEDDVVDFISFMDKYIASRKDLAEGSHQIMRGTRKHILFAFNLVNPKMLKQWKAMNRWEKKKNPDFLVPNKQVDFDQIDYNWITEFQTYLLNATFTEKKNGIETVLHYSKNYIAKEIKTAKQIANAAVKAGYIHSLSHRGLQSNWEDADSVYLNWDEIQSLRALELDPNTTQGQVRNLFVFNCYCGLRYSDLYKLDKNRFTIKNGQLSLKIRMKKTDEIIHFPILKSAEDILKIYDYKLPDVCDPIYNVEIKQVCLKAGITNLETKRETRGGSKIILTIPKYDMVASHTARRSFATNFDEDGVPIKELMAVTGHTTEKAFKKYVKSRTETKFAGFLAVGAYR